MYRPNRIGPFPLVDLDAPAVLFATVEYLNGGATQKIAPITLSTVLVTETGVLRGYQNTIAIAALNTVSFGIPVDPVLVNEQSMQLSISGAARCYGSAVNNVTLNPFVARSNADPIVATQTTGSNESDDPFFLPCCASQVPGTRAVQASVNTSLAIGPFKAGSTPSTNPLILGWCFHNQSNVAVTLNLDFSIAVQRYLEDVQLFDPSR